MKFLRLIVHIYDQHISKQNILHEIVAVELLHVGSRKVSDLADR